MKTVSGISKLKSAVKPSPAKALTSSKKLTTKEDKVKVVKKPAKELKASVSSNHNLLEQMSQMMDIISSEGSMRQQNMVP